MKSKTSSNRAVALLLAVVMVFIAIATPIPASAATVTNSNSSSNSDYVLMPFFADATASTSTPGAVRVFSLGRGEALLPPNPNRPVLAQLRHTVPHTIFCNTILAIVERLSLAVKSDYVLVSCQICLRSFSSCRHVYLEF